MRGGVNYTWKCGEAAGAGQLLARSLGHLRPDRGVSKPRPAPADAARHTRHKPPTATSVLSAKMHHGGAGRNGQAGQLEASMRHRTAGGPKAIEERCGSSKSRSKVVTSDVVAVLDLGSNRLCILDSCAATVVASVSLNLVSRKMAWVRSLLVIGPVSPARGSLPLLPGVPAPTPRRWHFVAYGACHRTS